MELYNPNISLSDFFARVRQADQKLLLLDYDGTLAPFRIERDLAFPYPGVRERLDRLLDDNLTRLIIISGRAVEDLMPLLGTLRLPEIWGVHGAQRYRPEDGRIDLNLPDNIIDERRRLEKWAEKAGLDVYLEPKPAAVAFHWRGLPPEKREQIREEVRMYWSAIRGRSDFIVSEFDGGLEFTVSGINKGSAVKTVIREYSEGVPIAYLGDDQTDEDAFKALEGKGLRILVRRQTKLTAADIRIEPPNELLDFLDRWIQCQRR